MKRVYAIIGCEESQAVTKELRSRGVTAFSCDLKPSTGGHPEWHLQMDVFKAISGGVLTTEGGATVSAPSWDLGIFFPTCTYLTCSAEWAYKDGPFHQRLKPDTLTGKARREARDRAIEFVLRLYNSGIPRVAIENPVGVLSSRWRKPDQVIQPYEFGDDASKRTCLWLKNLPTLRKTGYVEPRMVNGRPRWGNQTDSGQNKLSPSADRAELRSKTYAGIAKAMADQWTKTLQL